MAGGMVVDRILLDAAAVDRQDDWSVWNAADDFLRWALTTAFLLPGEFPENLYDLNKVSYYMAQVDNGGHKQFAGNSGWQPDVIDRVATGLQAMKATEFSAIYAEFRRLMDDPEVRRQLLDREFLFEAPPTPIGDLDSRFFALGGAEKVFEHGIAWLRSLPNLVFLSPEELRQEKAGIVARNAALDARRAEGIAARERAEAADPTLVSARRLCALAGLTFSHLTAGSFTDRPDTMLWGVMTTDGVFTMRIGPKQAELQERATGKALGTVPVET